LEHARVSTEKLVELFYDDTVYSFERANEHSESTFGGPLEAELSGVRIGSRPLHTVASLSHVHIPQLRSDFQLYELLLIYGFNYSGCELRYRKTITGRIEILELSPRESSDDFPYANYPPLLPYVPLRVSETRRCTYLQFAGEFPNMAVQQPAELIVAVPPPATLGVSHWGRSGDAEGVTVVFECDLADTTVRAYNRCT
jgi:hypothetical protein